MQTLSKISIAALACFSLMGSGCQVTRVQDRAASQPTAQELAAATASDPLSGWKTYTDSGRGFTFRHPADTFASYDQTANVIHLTRGPAENGPVPDMTVSVIQGGVQMKTWEGMEIPYFKQLVSSFEYK